MAACMNRYKAFAVMAFWKINSDNAWASPCRDFAKTVVRLMSQSGGVSRSRADTPNDRLGSKTSSRSRFPRAKLDANYRHTRSLEDGFRLMPVRGIRGATSVAADTPEEIVAATTELLQGDPPRQSDRAVRRDRLGDLHHHGGPDVELSCRGRAVHRHAPGAAVVRERNPRSQQRGPLHPHLVASQHGQEAGRHGPRLPERSPSAAAGREERQ